MNLKVLRPSDGVMMKLVKYNLEGAVEGTDADASIVHNHVLDEANNTPEHIGKFVKKGETIYVTVAEATSAEVEGTVSGINVSVTNNVVKIEAQATATANNAIIDVKKDSDIIKKIELVILA